MHTAVEVYDVPYRVFSARIAILIRGFQEVEGHRHGISVVDNASGVVHPMRCASLEADKVSFAEPWDVRGVHRHLLNHLAVLIEDSLGGRLGICELFIGPAPVDALARSVLGQAGQRSLDAALAGFIFLTNDLDLCYKVFGAEAIADDERVVQLEHIDGIVATVWHNICLALRGAYDALLAALFDGIVQQFKNDVREVLVLERQLAVGGVGAFVLANRNLPLIEELLDGGLRACAIWQVQIVLASLEPIHLIIADAG